MNFTAVRPFQNTPVPRCTGVPLMTALYGASPPEIMPLPTISIVPDIALFAPKTILNPPTAGLYTLARRPLLALKVDNWFDAAKVGSTATSMKVSVLVTYAKSTAANPGSKMIEEP